MIDPEAGALTVLFVDDDPLAAGALETWLGPVEGIVVHAVGAEPDEVLAACERLRPAAVLVDLVLAPGGPDGVELATAIRVAHPKIVPIMVTSSLSPDDADRAWRAGIRGYITKQGLIRGVERLPEVIRFIISRGVIYQVDPRGASNHDVVAATLSAREIDVLRRKGQGMRHREIADDLGIGVRTIDSHLANARVKLGAASVAEALRFARGRGLIG